MNTITTNEGVMNNSSQPQIVNKGSISDLSTLIMYKRDLELLQRDGVKESIQKIVEFHKNIGSGESLIRMGERLLLEYNKPKWSDEVELQFLKEDLDELENQKSYWKSRIVEGRRSFWDKCNSKYKGVFHYDTMD